MRTHHSIIIYLAASLQYPFNFHPSGSVSLVFLLLLSVKHNINYQKQNNSGFKYQQHSLSIIIIHFIVKSIETPCRLSKAPHIPDFISLSFILERAVFQHELRFCPFCFHSMVFQCQEVCLLQYEEC